MSSISSSHLPAPEQIAAQAAAALVHLEMPFGTAMGFLVGDAAGRPGYLVTNLHAVAGAASIRAELPGGERVQLLEVAGIDARHDLALLRVPDVQSAPLQGVAALPRVGARVFVAVRVGGEPRGVLDTQVRTVQQLGPNFTALELGVPLPSHATGAPALDAAGRVVGVATAARREEEEVTLVILWRYVQALLLDPRTLPLSSLARPLQRAARPRDVPDYPLALLEGCPVPALESIARTLAQVIRVGAPAYNRGDVEACAQLYASTFEQLLHERTDCPGPSRALREGLERAQALEDADERAWSLRDTIDGLLIAIERWMQARTVAPAAAPGGPAHKQYLN
jgi:hypothetical protein